MTTMTRKDEMLGLYLNDHLAGATAGVELAKRMAGENHDPAGRQEMARLAEEINEDREALIEVLATLDLPRRQYKAWLGWLGEKAARLKLNGRVLTRSPLSRVVELEALRLGIEGKASVWRTLRNRAEADPRLDTDRFERLIDRARQQADQVEDLRVLAATDTFGGATDPLKTLRDVEEDS
jgi:hypothetical protein